MCGIAGYAGCHRPELLEPMCGAMIHRGPDDSGTWYDSDAGIGLGHRRLSIIDLSPAGRQPMRGASGDTWITYNGEIYNFQEHRDRLERDGYPFQSRSDTEVLLALYEERGLDFVDELNGIFALGLWDARERRLVLARDHAGVKPLYYWQDGTRLYFASEIKALLTIPEIPRKLHMESVADYLTFLWVPGEYTLLEGVKKLEPGHRLVWKNGDVDIRRWFHIDYTPDPGPSADDWVEQVHDTFLRTTRRQMVSDVPLGAFLSGGLDSSGIVACMRQAFPAREITCYTVRFDPGDMAKEQGVDDYPYARRVARELDVRLKSIQIEPDVIDLLPKMIYHLDEADADPAVFPSYLISKLAREDGTTVLLSGTGGDEVFFGYRSHTAYRLYERYRFLDRAPFTWAAAMGESAARATLGAQHRIARRIEKFRRGLGKRGLDRHVALAQWSSAQTRASIFSPDHAQSLRPAGPPACMQRYFDEFKGRGELNCHSHLLVETFLAAHNFNYTDKSSMAVSLEARVPFMDVELMRLAARIPEHYKLHGNEGKWVLKKAMERYLPMDLLYRSKTGFGAPLRKWVQQDLREVIEYLLGPSRVQSRGIFDGAYVKQLLDENSQGREDHSYLIYALLTLELWMEIFVDNPGVEVRL